MKLEFIATQLTYLAGICLTLFAGYKAWRAYLKSQVDIAKEKSVGAEAMAALLNRMQSLENRVTFNEDRIQTNKDDIRRLYDDYKETMKMMYAKIFK